MDYTPFLFVFLFPVMWLIVGALLSVISGWFSLADTFRKDEAPSGEKFSAVSGSIGPVNYSNCLNVVVSANGLYIRILFLFRFLCPPLFIPWAAVEAAVPKRFFFVFPYVQLKIRDRWQSISIYGKASNAILTSYSQSTGDKKR